MPSTFCKQPAWSTQLLALVHVPPEHYLSSITLKHLRHVHWLHHNVNISYVVCRVESYEMHECCCTKLGFKINFEQHTTDIYNNVPEKINCSTQQYGARPNNNKKCCSICQYRTHSGSLHLCISNFFSHSQGSCYGNHCNNNSIMQCQHC